MNIPTSTLQLATQSFWATLFALAGLISTGAQAADQQAPEIIGKTLSGGLFKLSSLRGQPVVLNFFTVSCIPCREEMPELAAKAKQFPKARFVSVHVYNVDDSAVSAFVKKLSASPPTIVLAGQRVQQIYKTDTRGLPETHLIDSRGIIVQTLNGYTPETMAALKAWLEKQR